VDKREFVISETSRTNDRIYYRVKVDGIELRSLVCILASQKNSDSEKELQTWCKNNAARLESKAVLQADLSRINDKML
jgi:hypothetical protein